MANHEHWLAVCRATVTGHHSKTRKVWNRLSPARRGVLLHAAGMKSFFCNYSWDDFNERELHQLKRGIQRLQVMVSMFGGFNDLDFRAQLPGMPVKKVQTATQATGANSLRAKADLLQRLKVLHVNH
ncbi:hypothetical protein [Gibbsiella quercinecans]|uniref:hypothetical protein n=1 Tax=Gibbsiella quercinecans TaxID=929813 RepID=UPI002430A51F|nr:hypothetical protein [Gibbsiella quercinecans]